MVAYFDPTNFLGISLFFFEFSILVLNSNKQITEQITSRTKNRKEARTAKLARSHTTHNPRSRRTPGPKASKNRNKDHLRGAGRDDEEAASVGGPPQARSAPDPGPAPPHLTGDGRIFHQHATNPHSRRLETSPPAVYTLATNLPSPPEIATADG